MLSAAFGDWIRTLQERDFDDTFLALLRTSGFYDVHFTHGGHEYGKDVVAKRESPPIQYAFQCKAGDIGGSEWDKLFAQLHQLTSTALVHPSFDGTLPCHFVLTTTGRLKGKAPLCAKDFKVQVESQPGRSFDTWDEGDLRDMLDGRGASLPPGPCVLPILGRIASGTLEEHELEPLLGGLLPPPSASENLLFRSILDNTLVTSSLSRAGLPFHALTVTLNEFRIVATRVHDTPADAVLLREAVARYLQLGDSTLAPLLADPESIERWVGWCGGMMGKILAYPAICLRVVEFLGLAALADPERRAERMDALSRIVAKQPGVARPISDRYAASLAPAVITLARFGHPDQAASLLVAATRWVCDRYQESAFGLADARSTPKEEAEALLGAPFEFVALQERRESLLAVALVDLAHACAPTVYGDIVNDLLAVRIIPAALHAHDEPLAYRVGKGAVARLVNVRYPEHPAPGALPHHGQQGPRLLERMGYAYALLAVACLVRDRLFSDCYPRLMVNHP